MILDNRDVELSKGCTKVQIILQLTQGKGKRKNEQEKT
jgi:hypothetical protein